MKKRGGVRFIFILALIGAGFFCAQTVLAAGVLNINTATLAELDGLPGIGEVKAQAIIDYRTIQPFLVIEDIMKVSGIKQATFDAIKDLIIVAEEAASVESSAASSTESVISSPAETAGSAGSPAAGENGQDEYDFSSQIYISEIMPNPAGDDAGGEFIELFNGSAREVDLNGWSISNQSGKRKYLQNIASSTKLAAGDYLALFRSATKIVLRNDSGEVRLFEPLSDKPLKVVAYKDVTEGWSYNRMDDGDWAWSQTPTLGKANLIKSANRPPEADFNFIEPVWAGAPVKFDASDSSDEDGDRLKFSWDFGDGQENNLAAPEHTYFKAGTYRVKLSLSDGKETATKEKSLKVHDRAASPYGRKIMINELLPDPEGADSGAEWLELYNRGADRVNLKNWLVRNENGKYEFKNDSWLEAGEYYVLPNKESGLSLKNKSDAVKIYDPSGQLTDSVEYVGASKGAGYARGLNGNWFWTTSTTPGEENVIKLAAVEAAVKSQVLGVKDASQYAVIEWENLSELEIGDLIKIKGVVSAEPGVLGTQIFYLADSVEGRVAARGLQIYNYKKDFPILRVGDYLEVSGELAQSQGEARLKTKDKNAIIILNHKTPPKAVTMSADAIGEENVGQLVSASGEITGKKSPAFYLDDGSDEILVYVKKSTGIATKDFSTGQTATITGIVGKTSSGLRLLPRSKADIILAAASGNGSLEPRVLGEVASADEWDVAARDKKNELLKYLLVIAAGVIIILAGLFVKVVKKPS